MKFIFVLLASAFAGAAVIMASREAWNAAAGLVFSATMLSLSAIFLALGEIAEDLAGKNDDR